jgi:hypothetical protein
VKAADAESETAGDRWKNIPRHLSLMIFSKGWQTLVLAVGTPEGYEAIHVDKLGDV